MGGFGLAFPGDPNDPNLVMDRGGYTGRGPLIPRRRRQPGDPPDPSDQGYGAQDPEFGPTSSAPLPSSVPPRQAPAAPPPVDSGYDKMVALSNDPRQAPKSKGLGYRILGGLAAQNPIAAQFAPDIVYGTKAAEGERDWQHEWNLQKQRVEAGQREQQHSDTRAYHDILGQYHQDSLDERERKAKEIAADTRQKEYDTAQSRAAQVHARPMPSDVPLDIGTVPGRLMVPRDAGRITVPANPQAQPGDFDAKPTPMYIPSQAQQAGEKTKAVSTAASTDDITNAQIDYINSRIKTRGGASIPKRPYDPAEQKRIEDMYKTERDAEQQAAKDAAKADKPDKFAEHLALRDASEQKRRDAENKRKADAQFADDLAKADDHTRTTLTSLANETEFKDAFVGSKVRGDPETIQRVRKEQARRMESGNQAKKAAYDKYRQGLIDAGQDPGPYNAPKPYDTSFADAQTAMTGTGKAAATQSALPARSAPNKSAAPPPQAALDTLKEGVVTTFGNGQQWTRRNGKPQQVGFTMQMR